MESEEHKVEESIPRIDVVDHNRRRRVRVRLVEVFSVCILHLPVTGSYIYGTITITDGLGSRYLYNRKREESPQLICPGDTVLLTDPPFSILALDNVYMDVDLRDRDRDDIPPPNHDFIRDPFECGYDPTLWECFNRLNVYDKPLYEEIESKYFKVGVTFIVFRDAVEATVNVKLIVPDPKFTPKVFGWIKAGNCNFPEKSVLFQKTPDEPIEVRPGELIPLSKSIVSVPLNSVLTVQANLSDAVSSGGDFLQGTAEFPIIVSEKFYKKRIRGPGIEIQVEVTWADNRFFNN